MYLGKYIIYNNSVSKIIYTKHIGKYYQTIAERLGHHYSVLEVLRDVMSNYKSNHISLTSPGSKSYLKITLVQWAFMKNEIRTGLIGRGLFMKNFQKEL